MKKKNKENILEKIKLLLQDKKKRHLVTLCFILPFLIVIGIFGFKIYKEAKSIMALAGETGTEAVSSNYSIKMNEGKYVLRDNATDIQKTYFGDLKKNYEKNEGTAEDKAANTVKCFVADFFTFSNKVGQYDVGGTQFVFEPQRKNTYIKARDQFYKYLTTYIDKYGADVLLEVESVNATATELPVVYEYEGSGYGAFKVTADWTYVLKDGGFDTSKFDKRANFLVVENGEKFEIVYMGKEEYKANEEEN